MLLLGPLGWLITALNMIGGLVLVPGPWGAIWGLEHFPTSFVVGFLNALVTIHRDTIPIIKAPTIGISVVSCPLSEQGCRTQLFVCFCF